jgi:hypothetical protein
MASQGADLIDVGGESTRPGVEPVPAEEELRRVLPVIRLLKKELDLPVSVDTYKHEVALEALSAGADLVKANALKVFIILLYTPLALAFFMYYHQVDYVLGFVLALGNMTGAWLGTRVAVSWGPRFVRIILLLALFVSAAKLTGLLDWLAHLAG